MISDGELRQMIREGEELGYSTIVEALVELEAYRKAFSEPVCCMEPPELSHIQLGDDGRVYNPSAAEHGDILLYRKPTIPS